MTSARLAGAVSEGDLTDIVVLKYPLVNTTDKFVITQS